jgi:hypothetical protein
LVEAMDDESFGDNVGNRNVASNDIQNDEFNATISDSFLERAIVSHMSEDEKENSIENKTPERKVSNQKQQSFDQNERPVMTDDEKKRRDDRIDEGQVSVL